MVLITNVKYQNVYIFRPAKFGNGQIIYNERKYKELSIWVVKNQEICK